MNAKLGLYFVGVVAGGFMFLDNVFYFPIKSREDKFSSGSLYVSSMVSRPEKENQSKKRLEVLAETSKAILNPEIEIKRIPKYPKY